MKDGSWEEDEDNEVEEVGSPQKRKRVSTDEGSWDKKGKKKTDADWEAESRWRDQVEARLESMDSVLRKIAGCLEGIKEMMEDRWFEEGEVEDVMVE